MVATTCPAVTSSPSFTFTVASRPGYFAATSTCVASMRPFDLTIPSGMSRPRRRLMRVSAAERARAAGLCCAGWARAAEITVLPLENPKAHTAMDRAREMRTAAGSMALRTRADIRALLRTVPLWPTLSATDPDRHARLKPGCVDRRIEAQAQRISIMIPDRALGLPSCERPERHQLGNDGRCRFARARAGDLYLRPHREAEQENFPPVARQPLPAGRLDHEHWLAGVNVLADLGDDHADDAVGRGPQDGLVELPLQNCERGRRGLDLRVRDGALLLGWPGDGGGVIGF